MTDPELLATCWLHAGDVRPGRTADTSPLSIEERIDAVAEAGYYGVGIGGPDLEVARDRLGWNALVSLITAARIAFVELEFINDFWLDEGTPAAANRAMLFEAASVLHAHHIKVGGGPRDDPADEAVIRAALTRLGDEAMAAETRVALEPGADSALRDYERTIRIVRELDHPGVGMMADVWQLNRAGFVYERLLDVLPPHLLVAVELSDAASEVQGGIFEDTFDHRLYPGQGDFDVRRFVGVIRQLGFTGPWGLELMSDTLRRQPIAQTLADARDAAVAVLE